MSFYIYLRMPPLSSAADARDSTRPLSPLSLRGHHWPANSHPATPLTINLDRGILVLSTRRHPCRQHLEQPHSARNMPASPPRKHRSHRLDTTAIHPSLAVVAAGLAIRCHIVAVSCRFCHP